MYSLRINAHYLETHADLTLCASAYGDFDTYLSVYQRMDVCIDPHPAYGCISLITYNDDKRPPDFIDRYAESEVTWLPEADATYLLQVTGYTCSNEGHYELAITATFHAPQCVEGHFTKTNPCEECICDHGEKICLFMYVSSYFRVRVQARVRVQVRVTVRM